MSKCVTHFYGCECLEAKFKLMESALKHIRLRISMIPSDKLNDGMFLCGTIWGIEEIIKKALKDDK